MSSRASSSSGSRSSSASVSQSPQAVGESIGRAEPHPIFALDAIPCSLTPDELQLIRVQYGVLPEYELELPSPSDRASAPPSDCFCLYQEAFRAGLRLPLLPFVIALFQFLDISLASVAPKDRKSTRLNSSHSGESRMPSSA